jgi:hypothetical protein
MITGFTPGIFKDCANCPYFSIMRASFALVIYHSILFLVLINVKNTRDSRQYIQNGFWTIKGLIFIAMFIGFFYIPEPFFYKYWIAALVFSAIFIVLQCFLLVDFSWSLAQKWIDKWEENGDEFFKYLLIFSSLLFYSLSIATSCYLYIYKSCESNNWFVSVNLVFSILHTIIAVSPKVQENNPKSGLMQSSILMLYTTYLVASAIISQPKTDECNGGGNDNPDSTPNISMIVLALIFTFLSLGYSAFAAGSSTSDIRTYSVAGDESGDVDDESEETAYSYSIFHLVFVMASFYMAMVLSNWGIVNELDNSEIVIQQGYGAMWVKISMSWFCIVLYIWTLVAPIILPDRDFGV